ncbi:protein lin-9 homolog [Anopheles bellator]|uniref:protein lin-9 homolog n=1 Tax=Anopheles bellator TaxID=139047 RepID=UPI00264865DA|nr:protein lin-9 homolog [Anopheles bellator]
MESDGSPPPAFGPAALGLHPVGTKFPTRTASKMPVQVLNARGMPARIRKKNRMFFDDNIVNDKVPGVRGSPKKTPMSTKKSSIAKGTPGKLLCISPRKLDHFSRSIQKKKYSSRYAKLKDSMKKRKIDTEEKNIMQSINPIATWEKKMYQTLGLQIKSLLRLRRAHCFVYYEWFYSDIDQYVLGTGSPFQQLMKEQFPQLKTNNLTRAEWNRIRASFGKPRIFSRAFVAQERAELFKMREKVRILQGNNLCDISFSEGLPNNIPRRIAEGTRVMARLYGSSNDGVFDGIVEGYAEEERSYQIVFDRPTIKPCLVPDTEVSSVTTTPTIKLNSITKDYREALKGASFHVAPRMTKRTIHDFQKSRFTGDPLIVGGSKYSAKKGSFPGDYIGGYPVTYLELIVRTKKTVSAKQMKLLRLQNMSSEAEIYQAYQNPYPEEFKRRYAMLILAIEKLNRDLEKQLEQLKVLVTRLTHDPEMIAMIIPSRFREQCREKANKVFDRHNKGNVKNEQIADLIKNLVTILYLASSVGTSTTDIAMEMRGCLAETRERLEPGNVSMFNTNVAYPFNYLQLTNGNVREGVKVKDEKDS